VLLQAAPFAFFEFMTNVKRDLWSALFQLAPLIFQTHIEDMEIYLVKLKSQIQNFIFYLMKGTVQWVNKPKFHMLFHLPKSIHCFGPASLFATEQFEGYNSVLRNASIHSNRQSPSKDIGVTFANFQNLRHLFSSGTQRRRRIGRQRSLFWPSLKTILPCKSPWVLAKVHGI
jgi:hypothetical protein